MPRKKFHPQVILALAVAWAAGSAAGGGSFQGPIVVEDFEHFVWGGTWATVQATGEADPRMKAERETVHSGRQACRLDVPPDGSLSLAAQSGTGFVGKGDKPPLPLPGVPERVGLWVHGTRSGHRLWLALVDRAGKGADVSLGAVDFDGWRLLEGEVPKLEPPLGLAGLLVRGGAGPLVVDDVTVTTSADAPLYLAAPRLVPEEEFIAGHAARFRLSLQSLSPEPIDGDGEAVAHEVGKPDEAADRARFYFRVSASEPFERTVRLRLDAGVYTVVVRAGGAECRQEVAVAPASPGPDEPDASRAISRFGERGDALRVYESALSPAVVIEAREGRLTLFRGMKAAGLSVPRDGLMKTSGPGEGAVPGALDEPWVLLWFGGSPEWFRVTFADGSPCPTFDVPFLVVFNERPETTVLSGEGLEIAFGGSTGRVAVMPLLGVARPSPSATARWKEEAGMVGALVAQCRFWARALRAFPIAVEEERRLDLARDEVDVRLAYSYLESRSRWGEAPRRVAPVPPLLALALQAGMPVRFSQPPKDTGCLTSVGPYLAVPDADTLTYTLPGLLRHVNRAVSDLPPGAEDVPLTLARNYRTLASDVARIPFWCLRGGERGRGFSEALLRYILRRDNAHYRFDRAGNRLEALDGLAWDTLGDEEAAAAVAEHLRGCWYGGFHGGLWDLLKSRWGHIACLHAALATEGEWATLGLGSSTMPADARLNAELFFARLAAHLGRGEAYAGACGRLAKLLAASQALVAGAPRFTAALKPWPGLVGHPEGGALGRCLPGNAGLSPGPRPLVTSPSDAGYAFASAQLREYFRDHFNPGQQGYYGRAADEWVARRFVELDAPRVSKRFRDAPADPGPYSGNFVCTVEAGPEGWPCIVWKSLRSPAGGPLLLCGIGAGGSTRGRDAPPTRGRLRAAVTVSRCLRLSAYEAIPGPPPARGKEAPEPQPPAAPPSPAGGDTPAQAPR